MTPTIVISSAPRDVTRECGIWHRAPEFAAYIRERYAIRRRKLEGLPRERWTTDPVLAKYKFCNVRRAWDRTSVWLKTNWYDRHFAHPEAGPAAALARFVGYVPSLAELPFPQHRQRWDMFDIQRTLHARAARGKQVFTGAYMIFSGRGMPSKRATKIDTVCEVYLDRALHSTVLRHRWPTCASLYAVLRTWTGWGTFMTQEVIQDLLWTNVLAGATDRTTFAVAGPGAQRGLRWVLGDTHTKRTGGRQFTDEHATDCMTDLYRLLKTRHNIAHPLHIPSVLRYDLTVHDIEFNLCEFDKYMRTVTGTGNPPRSCYTPTTPTDALQYALL